MHSPTPGPKTETSNSSSAGAASHLEVEEVIKLRPPLIQDFASASRQERQITEHNLAIGHLRPVRRMKPTEIPIEDRTHDHSMPIALTDFVDFEGGDFVRCAGCEVVKSCRELSVGDRDDGRLELLEQFSTVRIGADDRSRRDERGFRSTRRKCRRGRTCDARSRERGLRGSTVRGSVERYLRCRWTQCLDHISSRCGRRAHLEPLGGAFRTCGSRVRKNSWAGCQWSARMDVHSPAPSTSKCSLNEIITPGSTAFDGATCI